MSGPEEPTVVRAVIIDDTPDLRTLLSVALGGHGIDVVGEAGDGRAGIELVREQHPDLVMLDLAMPVMDGLEALPSIRALCPDARIVVLSGFGAEQMSRRALSAGADGYIQKGTSISRMLGYLDTITAGVRAPSAIGLEPPGTRSSGNGSSPSPMSPAAAPTRPDPTRPDPTRPGAEPAAEAGAAAAAAAAVEHAPFGVVRLDGPPRLTVQLANLAARQLLRNRLTPGTSLGQVAPELAAAVAERHLVADASFEVRVDGVAVRAAMRCDPTATYLYLVPGSEDSDLLRRAIATTAHELRGPVSVISGVAEMIGDLGADMDPGQRGRLLGSVARQARMLDGLTADLLTAAQIEGGTLRVDLEEVDPRALVDELVTDRPDVRVESLGDLRVRADPLRLVQIVENLLSNAHKYAQPPYELRIYPDGDRVRIEVRDEGEGVPVEFRPHLFDEFARAPGTRARGTGLGLYIVRTLAEAQDGSAEYAPRAGGGSVFSVTLRGR